MQRNNRQPISSQLVTKILLLLVVILSLAAGYYHALCQNWEKKYNRLENMYVRLRSQLGAEETQKLIDQSYAETP